MNEAKLQFDNAIKEAYLNNDVNKANLALQILQQQQEEALRNFNYISDTKQNQLSNNQALDSDYYNRYNTLYSQIQQEKATAEAIRQWEAEMAEQQRQYNESLALQREQMAQEQARWEKEYALSKATAYNNSRSSNHGSLTDSNSGSLTNTATSGNSYPYGASGSLLGLLGLNGSSNSNSNKTYSARSTPARFSSNMARSWYDANISGKSFSQGDLENTLASGLKRGTISESDVKSILKK